MLVHTVFFWLRSDLSAEEVKEFQAGLDSLRGIEAANQVFIGTPAETPDRPVVDRGYSYCLTVILPDVDAHNVYQSHPLHDRFVADHKDKWERVLVYDAD